MNGTLNTIIAFLVVIIALASLLQILADWIKNMGFFKWRTYKLFLRGIYSDIVSEKHEGQDPESLNKEIGNVDVGGVWNGGIWNYRGPVIHSVTDRLKEFDRKLRAAGEVVREIQSELKELDKGLKCAKPAALGPSAKHLRAWIESRIEKKSEWVRKLKALEIGSLLSMYQQVSNTVKRAGGRTAAELAANATPGDAEPNTTGALATAELINLFRQVDEVAGNLAEPGATEKAIDTALRRAAPGIKEATTAALKRLSSFEDELAELLHTFDTKMESLVSEAQQSYSNRIAKYRFRIALVLCLFINADAVSIYKSLSADPALRAEVESRQNDFTRENLVQSFTSDIDDLGDAHSRLVPRLEALTQKPNTGLDVNAVVGEFQLFSNQFFTVARRIDNNENSVAALGRNESAIEMATTMKPLELANAQIEDKNYEATIEALDPAIAGLLKDNYRLNTAAVEMKVDLLTESSLPLGWDWDTGNPACSICSAVKEWGAQNGMQGMGSSARKLFGIWLTAFLISFGSGFWNDFLKSLLGIRGFLNKSDKDQTNQGTTP